jgi:uncharacterized membrane protein required for colicin V production
MTIYDAAMIGVVIAGMIWGALRGITWQLASIASLVLGYSVAYPLSGQLAHRFPGEPVVARALAMLVVYVAVSGGIFLAAWIVRTTLQRWKFDAFDRHLGMILGGLEGALLGVVATLFVVSLAPRTRETILTSTTGTAVNRFMTALGPILPGEIRDVMSPFDQSSDPIAPTFERVEADPTLRTDRAPGEDAEPATLDDFYEEGRSRLGRAVLDTAEQELRRARTQGSRTAGASDEALEPATLNDLYRESRSRVGRAILDSAEQELQRARGANDGTVKRR